MSLGDESGLGPDPATYAPLGQPGAVPEDLATSGLEDDPLNDRDDVIETDPASDVDPGDGSVR